MSSSDSIAAIHVHNINERLALQPSNLTHTARQVGRYPGIQSGF
jgi:hypothetical protein